MTDQAKILKLCEFEGFRMTITDFQRGAEAENKRLLPIIHAILADRERLRSQLMHECCCPGERSHLEPYDFITCDACDCLKASDAADKLLLGEDE